MTQPEQPTMTTTTTTTEPAAEPEHAAEKADTEEEPPAKRARKAKKAPRGALRGAKKPSRALAKHDIAKLRVRRAEHARRLAKHTASVERVSGALALVDAEIARRGEPDAKAEEGEDEGAM
jgi:hypothetical protein